MSDVPHIGFIVGAYAVTVVVLIGMATAVLLDGRAQRRALARLEDRVSSRGRKAAERRP